MSSLHRPTLVLLLPALLLLISSCRSGGYGSGDPEGLLGTSWELIEVEGEVLLEVPEERPTMTLLESERRATGSTGVNTFNGSYSLEGRSLEFGPIAATRRAGSPAAMELETRLLASLERVDRLRYIEGDLVLTFEGEMLLRWRRAGSGE